MCRELWSQSQSGFTFKTSSLLYVLQGVAFIHSFKIDD